MTFFEAEEYLLSLSKIHRREFMKDPKQCDVYIKRLQFFLDIVGNPEKKIPHYIHVTGTSGKGSVTNMLHSILRASGKRVGSTISPPETIITERWRVDNHIMSKAEFISLVKRIKKATDIYMRTSPYDPISFFELTTVIALLYFAEKNVEWAVVEVGCGGRYDATNVIPHKDIAIITSIGLDHTEIIGNTRELIAHEKAGIITKGCHVFTQESKKHIRDIIYKEADKKHAISCTYVPKACAKDIAIDWSGTHFSCDETSYQLPCIGEHQAGNAVLVIKAAEQIGISAKAIKKGLSSVNQKIRCEVVSREPYIILDSAHNDDKIKATITTIQTLISQKKIKQVHLLIGITHGKTVHNMIKELSKLHPVRISCTRQNITTLRTAENPATLGAWAKKYAKQAEIELFIDAEEALAWSKKGLKKGDLLLITGSGFIAGELRPRLTKATF